MTLLAIDVKSEKQALEQKIISAIRTGRFFTVNLIKDIFIEHEPTELNIQALITQLQYADYVVERDSNDFLTISWE